MTKPDFFFTTARLRHGQIMKTVAEWVPRLGSIYLLAISLMRTKLPARYVLPIYPAVALAAESNWPRSGLPRVAASYPQSSHFLAPLAVVKLVALLQPHRSGIRLSVTGSGSWDDERPAAVFWRH